MTTSDRQEWPPVQREMSESPAHSIVVLLIATDQPASAPRHRNARRLASPGWRCAGGRWRRSCRREWTMCGRGARRCTCSANSANPSHNGAGRRYFRQLSNGSRAKQKAGMTNWGARQVNVSGSWYQGPLPALPAGRVRYNILSRRGQRSIMPIGRRWP